MSANHKETTMSDDRFALLDMSGVPARAPAPAPRRDTAPQGLPVIPPVPAPTMTDADASAREAEALELLARLAATDPATLRAAQAALVARLDVTEHKGPGVTPLGQVTRKPGPVPAAVELTLSSGRTLELDDGPAPMVIPPKMYTLGDAMEPAALAFGKLADGIRARPFQGRLGQAPTSAPRPGADAPLGRVRAPETVTPARPTVPAGVTPTEEPATQGVMLTDTQLRAAADRGVAAGVLITWEGRGELARATILARLDAAGVPRDCAPTPKTDHAHASEALRAVCSSRGYVVRTDRARGGVYAADRSGHVARYAARWTVGAVGVTGAGKTVGEAYGKVALTVGLTTEGALHVAGPSELAATVQAEYARRRDASLYQAGDVTYWLDGLFSSRFGAVAIGPMWFVPERTRVQAETLAGALSQVWGAAWQTPGLPVTTGAGLRAGLVRAFEREADAVLAEYESQRETARKDREGGDIGVKAARSMLEKLGALCLKAKSYRDVLGEGVADVATKLKTAHDEIAAKCDGATLRAFVLELS